jgi:hypothetical protein
MPIFLEALRIFVKSFVYTAALVAALIIVMISLCGAWPAVRTLFSGTGPPLSLDIFRKGAPAP